jgi:hypothetical protein
MERALFPYVFAEQTLLHETEAAVHFYHAPIKRQDRAAKFFKLQFVKHVVQDRVFYMAAHGFTSHIGAGNVKTKVASPIQWVDFVEIGHSHIFAVTDHDPILAGGIFANTRKPSGVFLWSNGVAGVHVVGHFRQITPLANHVHVAGTDIAQ